MRYECTTCKEQFSERVNCVQHHMEEKHEEFELLETYVKLTIKTPSGK